MYYLQFLGQEYGCSVARCLWLKVCNKSALSFGPGLWFYMKDQLADNMLPSLLV